MYTTAAESVDVVAIAHLALDPPEGMTPDQVIERELVAGGVTGGYRSLEFRRLHHLCCDARADLRAELRAQRALQLSADQLWVAYDAGYSQHRIARKLGLLQGQVSDRSCELGFVLARDPANGNAWSVSVGPCVGCGRPSEAAALDDRRRCGACAQEDD